MKADVRIDIVSDIVCPWCIVGYKQLERALVLEGVEADIVWHPFELNPDMAADGENLRDHIVRKYGATPEASMQARDRLKVFGHDLGFTFDFADDMKIYNTFKAHQLLAWAKRQGRQHELQMELFTAYFSERRNISDADVLIDAAKQAGLNRDTAFKVLTNEVYADQVRAEESFWTSRGIQGVPGVIFNGQHLVTGAQGVDNYLRLITKHKEDRAA